MNESVIWRCPTIPGVPYIERVCQAVRVNPVFRRSWEFVRSGVARTFVVVPCFIVFVGSRAVIASEKGLGRACA